MSMRWQEIAVERPTPSHISPASMLCVHAINQVSNENLGFVSHPMPPRRILCTRSWVFRHSERQNCFGAPLKGCHWLRCDIPNWVSLMACITFFFFSHIEKSVANFLSHRDAAFQRSCQHIFRQQRKQMTRSGWCEWRLQLLQSYLKLRDDCNLQLAVCSHVTDSNSSHVIEIRM